MANSVGYFLFSLDTELAWGAFDHFHPGMFSADGRRERYAIKRILDILDKYDIAATWALVGHLFFEKCEKCPQCPILEWKGKFSSFEEIYETSSPLWYGADIIRILMERSSRHEIAFHGFTHRIFDEKTMDSLDARTEILEWLKVASGKVSAGLQTVVFPRNKVGHLGVFKEYGFTCYRDDEVLPSSYYTIPFFGKALNKIDLVLQIRKPEIYDPTKDGNDLVRLPASRSLFRMPRKIDKMPGGSILGQIHHQKIIQGVARAAASGKVIHIYTHPWEFREEKDFARLEDLLSAVSQQIKNRRMISISMGSLAQLFNQVDKMHSSENQTEKKPSIHE